MESDTTSSEGSPAYSYAVTDTSGPPLSSSANLSVPPPRRRISLGNTREQYGPGGRSAGNLPVGILKCSRELEANFLNCTLTSGIPDLTPPQYGLAVIMLTKHGCQCRQRWQLVLRTSQG